MLKLKTQNLYPKTVYNSKRFEVHIITFVCVYIQYVRDANSEDEVFYIFRKKSDSL